VARFVAAAMLASMIVGCGGAPALVPTSTAVGEASPTAPAQVRPTRDVGQSARDLLAMLPLTAGGMTFDGVLVVDDSFNVGHPVDDVLTELGKRRKDAVAVDRWSDSVTISATWVAGVDGPTLLATFVRTWDAPAVIRRSTRAIQVGISGWELEERLGMVDVMYRLGDVVYLVSSEDRDLLEAVLRDMPRQP
jgi:hypothetical protein